MRLSGAKAMKTLLALLGLCLRTALARPGSILVIVLGSAGATMIFAYFMAMSLGLESAIMSSGHADRALILRKGADVELNSSLPLETPDFLTSRPEIARTAAGQPIISPELVRSFNVPLREGYIASFPIRGITGVQQDLRPEFRITDGRMLMPGKHELVVGRAVRDALGTLNVGDAVNVQGEPWPVVGVFTTEGNSEESEILADLQTLQSFYQIARISSVAVKLIGAAEFDSFKSAVEADPRLALDVERESDYYDRIATRSSAPLKLVSVLVGALMAVAAMFAVMSAVYSSVAYRVRELNTLRTIGFSGTSIMFALNAEAAVLSLVGALIGSGLITAFFDSTPLSFTTGDARLSQTAFHLDFSFGLLALATACILALSILGGLAPTSRLVRSTANTSL